ncbi:MAG: hypothetical protein NTW49_14310 [Bacteroidia bacterium]|nr:hypothetical protein [Bacteroidia bacterium]
MNSRESDKVSMYKAVRNIFVQYSTEWLSDPVLEESINVFDSKLNTLDCLMEDIHCNFIEFSNRKTEIRRKLTERFFHLASCILSYAAATGNDELYQMATWTETKFKRLKNDELAPVCQKLLELASKKQILNYSNLGESGMKELEQLIFSYKGSLDDIKAITVRRKATNHNIGLLISESDFVLQKRIDHNMVKYREQNPEFYQQYTKVRKISHSQGHECILTGKIIENWSKEPLRNVRVSIEALSLRRRSTIKGNFRFLKLPPGNLDLVCDRRGYAKFRQQYFIPEKGKVNIEINMERS